MLFRSLTEIERDTRVEPESILSISTHTNELTNDSLGELHEFGIAHAIYFCDKKYDRQVIPLKGNKLESRDQNTGILLKRRKSTDGQQSKCRSYNNIVKLASLDYNHLTYKYSYETKTIGEI